MNASDDVSTRVELPLNLESLVRYISNHSITDTYELLKYDYQNESRFEQGLEIDSARIAFLTRFLWRHEPSSKDIRRIFNQINTFYAEQWAMANLQTEPLTFVMECNRLILFRQGKRADIRARNISFGVRKNLDFLDPRRQFKLLRGIAPQFLAQAIREWSTAIGNAHRRSSVALLLAMALIAIHPFSDGNGRLARIAYTWILRRWDLQESWLAEDDEGEFLRTGVGILSTEHLMGMLMLDLCDRHNRIEYGFREVHSKANDEHAFLSLKKHLLNIHSNENSIMNSETFRSLWTHLQETGHFRLTSPRFESLKMLIQ